MAPAACPSWPAVAVLWCVCLLLPMQVHMLAAWPWFDPSLDFETRVEWLVANMTVDELIPQMIKPTGVKLPMVSPALVVPLSSQHRSAVLRHNLGRLLALAFDPELELAAGRTIALEGAAKHNDYLSAHNGSTADGFAITYYAPVVNIARSPFWGRTQESYGESVTLAGRLGAAYVQGIQLNASAIACPVANRSYIAGTAMAKHFLAYDIESGLVDGQFLPQLRFQFDANVSVADVQQTYLPAFQALVQDGHVATVMCSYNALNGTPMCASPLLNQVLRQQLGFQGAVWSDGGAVGFITTKHNYTPDVPTAAAAALNAGVDLNSGGARSNFAYLQLNVSLARGLVKEEQLRSAVQRLMLLRMRLGMFDPPTMVPFRALTGSTSVDTPAHRLLARQYAAESIVMLANRNATLPLLPSLLGARPLAVIGPNANSPSALLSNYAGCRLPFDGPIVPDCTLVTPWQGIAAAAQDLNMTALLAQGAFLNRSDAGLLQQALDVAENASAIVLLLGLVTSNDEGVPVLEAEGLDRTNLSLPEAQEALAAAVCNVAQAARIPVVLVLLNGGPLALSDATVACADAILEAFYPGEEGGNAIADILFGSVAPSGRLPYTLYPGSMTMNNHLNLNLAANGGQTFRYMDWTPLFGFGFGLSTTTFAYRDFSLSSATLQPGDILTATVSVVNTGVLYAADEVVQLYIAYQTSDRFGGCRSVPLWDLKAFQRIRGLEPGSMAAVTLTVPWKNLLLTDTDCTQRLLAGTYVVAVGGHGPVVGRHQPQDSLLRSSFVVDPSRP